MLVQQALEDMGDNCTGLDRNSACYGFNRVDSTFVDEALASFFSAPADRAGISQLETISTHPLDLSLDLWGVAVMNVQANVPNALPGQAAVFMLMGETQVENRVDPADAFVPADPVDVTLQSDSRVFALPQANSSVLMTADLGTVLPADGVNEDGTYLRVLTDRGIGWLRIETVTSDADLTALPALTPDKLSPMQAFHVTTAIGDVSCSEAPSLLAVQSPEGIKIDLTANGVHIRMGSLIMLRIVQPGDQIEVMTIYGDVTLDPDTDMEVHVLPGMSTMRCLDQDFGDVGADCGWSDPVPMTEEELAFAQTVLLAYQNLGLGGATLNLGGSNVTLINTDACPAGTVVNHVVNVGDTLFGLSLQYNTTVNAIAEQNHLTNTTIVIGQVLTVVCGAQGPADYPLFDVTPIVVDNPPPVPTTSCDGFKLTSPLDGIAYGSQTVYWDPAVGPVDGYRATISGDNGSTSANTGPDATNATLDTTLDNLGQGFNFTVTVDALVNGQPVCTSSASIQREAPPAPPEKRATEEPTPVGTEESCPDCECTLCG